MRIDLENLEKSGGKIDRTYATDELTFDERELQLLEPINVSGRIRRKDNEVDLRGKLHTKVAIPCGRCLKSVEFPIDVEFAERFTPAVSWKNEEQHELSEDDLNLAAFDGQSIELDDLVREEIVHALPGHVLCDEACRGLCPQCGGDLNVNACDCETKQIDSRWEKLRDLKF